MGLSRDQTGHFSKGTDPWERSVILDQFGNVARVV